MIFKRCGDEKTLLKELLEFRKNDRISFHMPGHKHGRGISRALKKHGMSVDVTEFDETDNLQDPKGILKEAERRAAEAFGARESFYLTNGSSGGLHAAILGSTNPGDTVLVDRTCHRAVIAALVTGRLKPYFIYPEFDEEANLYTGIPEEEIKRAVSDCPEAVGAIVTSPTYYGVCSDIRGIADSLHSRGKFLIVDEAHGAHFAFSGKLPETALTQGADICIQSVHKTLPAPGQTALLHIGKNSCVPGEKIRRALSVVATTSPSYMLMAAIDEAVLGSRKCGQKKMEILMAAAEKMKARIQSETLIRFADEGVLKKRQDSLRMVIDFKNIGISGSAAGEILKKRFGIYPEMADSRYAVLIITAANSKKEIDKLKKALLYIGKVSFEKESCAFAEPLPPPCMACLPHEAWYGRRKKIPAEDAEGKICAEIVGICPPGAAVLVPGQRIDGKAVRYIKKFGAADDVEVLADR